MSFPQNCRLFNIGWWCFKNDDQCHKNSFDHYTDCDEYWKDYDDRQYVSLAILAATLACLLTSSPPSNPPLVCRLFPPPPHRHHLLTTLSLYLSLSVSLSLYLYLCVSLSSPDDTWSSTSRKYKICGVWSDHGTITRASIRNLKVMSNFNVLWCILKCVKWMLMTSPGWVSWVTQNCFDTHHGTQRWPQDRVGHSTLNLGHLVGSKPGTMGLERLGHLA